MLSHLHACCDLCSYKAKSFVLFFYKKYYNLLEMRDVSSHVNDMKTVQIIVNKYIL